MRRLLVLALLAVTAVVADAGPVHACSVVVPPTDAEAVETADIAFTAQVVALHQDGERLTWDLDVEQVYRGVVADDQQVVTNRFDLCQSFHPRVGQRWLLMAHVNPYVYDPVPEPGQLLVSLGRTRALDKGEVPIVPEELPDLLW